MAWAWIPPVFVSASAKKQKFEANVSASELQCIGVVAVAVACGLPVCKKPVSEWQQ